MGIEIDPNQINMMRNGDFEAGGAWWEGSTGIEFSDGKARYSRDANSWLRINPEYLDLTIQPYRVKFTIDSISNTEIRVGLQGGYSPFYTTPGTKTVALLPEIGEDNWMWFFFNNLNGLGEAIIDNVEVTRIGELAAVEYNLLPDLDGKFEVFPASEDRQWGRLALWKDKSRVLFLYDPEED